MRARKLLGGLDFLVVQDIFLTRTARAAPTSCFRARPPGARPRAPSRTPSGACSACARRSTRPASARDDMLDPRRARAAARLRLGRADAPRRSGTSCGRSRPMHRGMSYDRLEALGGIQWPCPDEEHPGSPFLHGRLWQEPREGPRGTVQPVEHRPPFEALDADYPLRLTTGRRLESYNTGVQTDRYRSPLHRGESLDLSPEDAERLARRGRRDRARVARGAAPSRRRCGSTPRCGPGSRS